MRQTDPRVAVVSGGANGIGAAIVQRLRADGLTVASLDVVRVRRDDVLDVECDVASAQSVDAALERVRIELGPISVLVHCAAFQLVAPFPELDTADWARSFQVNVDGAFHLVRTALPDLRAAAAGRIILITSSSLYAPPPGMSHYIATKGALTGFARGLASELGPDGITVNCVAPGLTATENALRDIPEQHFALVQSRQSVPRAGRPEDTAAAVSYLASPDAAFVTGQTLLVDGGESRL